MMINNKAGIILSLAIGSGIAAYSFAQLGPLDPPPGPIADTSPSLDDLDFRLSQVQSASGPWLRFTRPTVGALSPSNRLVSEEIAGGRILVHAVIAQEADVFVFDGAGEINSSGFIQAGSVGEIVARHTNNTDFNNGGNVRLAGSMIVLDTVVQNGLHVSWRGLGVGNDMTFTVLYRPLP